MWPGSLWLIAGKSRTKCFDWEVPCEWNIRNAYIIDPDGNKFCDFKKSNIHVVGYSIPVKNTVSLDELQEHLYSLPEQPGDVPLTYADISKGRQLVGYEPKTDFQEGVRRFVKWLKKEKPL